MSACTAPAYRAIFFDLDGTLLPMDTHDFMGAYLRALGAYAARFGASPEAFKAGMKEGIKNMATHDGARPNNEAFWEGWSAHVAQDACSWEAEFERFYEVEFDAVGASVAPNSAAVRAIDMLAEKGYSLVLATMPMFPECAVHKRLQWAGIDPSKFVRLTHFENSTSVKPKPAYYAENLAAAGVRGTDVLMVGNNTVEDLDIQELGADTFLVTDYLLDPTGDFDTSSVKHGTMEEFAAWAEMLPVCANPASNIVTGLVSATSRERALAENLVARASASAAKADATCDRKEA